MTGLRRWAAQFYPQTPFVDEATDQTADHPIDQTDHTDHTDHDAGATPT
jgi:hypothetical protein